MRSSSMQLSKLSRPGSSDSGQALVEYALAIALLVVAFIVGGAAISHTESDYFTFLGPRLAPTPAAFGTFPPTPPAIPIVTPLPTATPFLQPTPTPTPNTSGNKDRTQ